MAQESPRPEVDSYRQPAGRVEAEIKVKGSRFLAEVIPAENPAAVQAGLLAVRKRFFDATHHCSAWRVGEDGRVFRSDDDGEPSGSAGLPILRQIDAMGLTNLLVVVTRWFGGTKLGTGGLVRAYGEAAHAALALAPIEERILRTVFRLDFSFGDTSPAMHLLSRFDTRILDTRYGTGTSMDVAVRRSQADPFEAAWVDALAGRGSIEKAVS